MSEAESAKRICPYCEEPKDSRGLYAHVMHSNDNNHGPSGSVPEGFKPRKAPVVTEDEKVIETSIKDEYENKLYLCHHCGTMCKGRRGLSIHLSKSAGDELHPPDSSIEDGNYTTIPADNDWNPVVDQEELMQLHSEIVADIHEYELYDPDEGPIGEKSDAELREHLDQAVIPTDQSKVEQVATLLNQVPEAYDRSGLVKEVINCSTTTFYEGRKMYDNGGTPDVEIVSQVPQRREGESVDRIEEFVWKGDDDSVVIGGEHYVPVSAVKGIVKQLNEANATLSEVSKEGAKLVHRTR